MKILKIVGIVLAVIVILVFAGISMMSPQAKMERSIVVNASPEIVFAQLASFENFNQWSPWTKMDPAAKQTVEGPATGIGAKMSWDGPETGKGSQWTVEYEENKRVKNAMHFEGMEGEIDAQFILEPVAEGTKVIWSYESDVSKTGIANSSMTKLFNAFALEGMLGKQYEEGLAALKQRVESMPPPAEPVAPADSTQTNN
ncbi:MAG: SRPBCC family protein [Cyclobacteriaceae bacterium]|nr:SRPBCC family protein [Cyclobacteriaceae bacterium]